MILRIFKGYGLQIWNKKNKKKYLISVIVDEIMRLGCTALTMTTQIHFIIIRN